MVNSSRVVALVIWIAAYFAITWLILGNFPTQLPEIVYPLDDSYIYMAMARNIADFGIWGITPHGFSGTSSSHIWIVFLAIAYKIFGPLEILPLVLNLLFGVLCFFVIVLASSDLRYSKKQLFASSGAFLFLAYIPQLTVIGMETVLHCLLTLAFVWFAIKLVKLKKEEMPSISVLSLTFLVTALFCACRYESCYAVAPFILIMLFKRRIKEAILLFFSACFPVFVYGAFSIYNGELFFPNTILIKGRVGYADPIQGLLGLPLEIGETLVKQLWLLGTLLIYMAVTAMKEEQRIWRYSCIFFGSMTAICTIAAIQKAVPQIVEVASSFLFFALIFSAVLALVNLYKRCQLKDENAEYLHELVFDGVILTIVAHVLTAKFGWLFRYEAYMLSIISLVLVPVLVPYYRQFRSTKLKFLQQSSFLVLAISFFAFGIFVRTVVSSGITPQSAKGVYYQHVRMGKFVNQYFPNATVVANDIGALCFYGKNIHIVDLWGLASFEVASLRIQRKSVYREFIEKISKKEGAAIATIQEPFWEKIGLPQSWYKAGKWVTPPYNGVGEVSFFAVDLGLKDKLNEDLTTYKLPSVDELIIEHDIVKGKP